MATRSPELNQAGGSAANGRLLAEAFIEGRRIEQGDVGPRAGRST